MVNLLILMFSGLAIFAAVVTGANAGWGRIVEALFAELITIVCFVKVVLVCNDVIKIEKAKG